MRKAFKIPLAAFSFVLFLIALLLYLYFFSAVPEKQANDWLTYFLENKLGYTITVERMNRDLWRKVRFDGIKIFYKSPGSPASIQVGDIDYIEIEYSLRNILFGNLVFDKLRIAGLNFSLLPDIRPQKLFASSPKKAPAEIKIPKIVFNDFKFENFKVKLLIEEEIADLHLDQMQGSLQNYADSVFLNVDSLAASWGGKDFAVENFAADFVLADNNLVVESLLVKTGRSDIKFSGRLDDISNPRIELKYSFMPLNLDDIRVLSGVKLEGLFEVEGDIGGRFKDFNGDINGNGILFEKKLENLDLGFRYVSSIFYFDKLKGSVFKAPVNGKGFINFKAKPETYGFEGNVRGLNLQNVGPELFSDLTGTIDLKGSGLSEDNFHINIYADLTKADLDIYHPRQLAGEIDFDLSRLNFHPGFMISYKDSWAIIEGYLEYVGQVNITGEATTYNLADFQNQFFITDLDGTASSTFSLTGPVEDFTLEARIQSDSCRFFGLTADTLSVDLKLKSFISHRVGKVQGFWRGGDLYSIPVDSGVFSVVVSGEKFFIDTLYWENKNNRMMARCSYDNGTVPPGMIIDTIEFRLWNDTISNAAPIVLDIYEKELEFKDFQLRSRSSLLDMTGTITYEGQMDLDLSMTGLDIKPIAAYFIADRVVDGVLSGEISIGGDFDSPLFMADITLSDLLVDEYALGDFNAKTQYRDRRLYFERAELQSETALYSVKGDFPLNLSFTSDEERFPAESIAVDFSASGKSIILAPVFVPSIESFECDFDVDIAITGTYNNPLVDGNFNISEGALKAIDLIDPLTDINVSGRMENDYIHIDNLTAFMISRHGGLGKKINKYIGSRNINGGSLGLVTGSGKIKLIGLGVFDYDLTLSGSACEFYTDAYDIQGIADFYITLSGSSPPVIKGFARLIRLEMKEPFATFAAEEEVEVLEDSTQWNIELDVIATNNMWIKNIESAIGFEPSADMELKGDLLLTRERGLYNILGELDVIRGDFYLGSLKFKVNSGELIFENIADIDPKISFDVTTRIRGAAIGGAEASVSNELNDFNLIITGTLTEPKIGTAEGSSYSEENLLAILLPNIVTGGEGTGTSGTFLVQRVSDYFTKPIEEIGVFDEVDFNPYDREGESNIAVAKYISPKLFLKYSHSLGEKTGEKFGIEYFINDNVSFEGAQGAKDEGVSLDLKFRYEY